MFNEAKLNHDAVPKPIVIKVKTKCRPRPDELVEYEVGILEMPHRERITFEVQMFDGDGNTV